MMGSDRLDKQDLAGAVVDAATFVLQSILTYRPTRGQIQITPLQYTRDDLTVVTRLSGDLAGEIFLGLEYSSALGIAGQMLRHDVKTLGALELSALAELGSMITDSSLAILEDQGVLCYGTWSSVIVGRDERVTPFALPTLAVPLSLIVGEININVLLEGYAPFSWASPSARLAAAASIRVPAPERPSSSDSLPLAA